MERSESAATLAEELRARLRDSVRAHLVADVPVGVLLSRRRRLGDALCAGRHRKAASASRHSRSASRSRASTSWIARGSSPSATTRITTSCWSSQTRHNSCLRSRACSTSRSPTRPRSPHTSSRSSRPSTSRSSCRERAVTSSSVGTTPTSPTCSHRSSHQCVACFARSLRPCRVSSKRVSFDYKTKRFTQGLGLPPLERHHAWKEIFSTDARAELLDRARGQRDANGDPVNLLRARYVETEGCAELTRLQDVDLGVLMVDDLLTAHRPREHGPLARSSRPLPRLGRVVFRLWTAPGTQGQALPEEATPPPGGRPADPSGDRRRKQTWLLDSGSTVAER